VGKTGKFCSQIICKSTLKYEIQKWVTQCTKQEIINKIIHEKRG